MVAGLGWAWLGWLGLCLAVLAGLAERPGWARWVGGWVEVCWGYPGVGNVAFHIKPIPKLMIHP